MPWDRSKYPADWDAIALAVKTEQDYVCAECRVQCYRPGETVETMTLVMSVAHWPDPTPSNVERENLRGLCSRCHLALDHPRLVRKAKYGAGALDPTHQPGLFADFAPFYPNARTLRYTYLGDRLTRPELVGMRCDPVRRDDGKCVVSTAMATALVEDAQGRRYVVARRRLRLNAKT